MTAQEFRREIDALCHNVRKVVFAVLFCDIVTAAGAFALLWLLSALNDWQGGVVTFRAVAAGLVLAAAIVIWRGHTGWKGGRDE